MAKPPSLIYDLEGWDLTDFPVLATEKDSLYVSLLLKTKQYYCYRTAHGCETRGATPGCHTFDLRKTFSPCLRTWLLHFTSRTIIIHPNTLFLLYNHIFKTKCWQKSRILKQKLCRISWPFESRVLAYVCVWRSFYFFQIASHLRNRLWNLLMRDVTRISALVKKRAKYMLMWLWFSASIFNCFLQYYLHYYNPFFCKNRSSSHFDALCLGPKSVPSC